ncbi:hypothetical protein RNJ44_03846 [Nakaseomyces bracarensis]|uniref:Uncharacterized protein n=1 Tax=Nakaseomyces bracarensis TaxID=273131 RepID=A0ABR4NY65_9SACH
MDPIISRFKELDVGSLGDDEGRESKVNVVREVMDEQMLDGDVLRMCETAVQSYSDLLKLEFVTTRSWYVTALYDSVLIRFGMKLEGAKTIMAVRGEEFYKDLALKSIKKCDKSAVGLESLVDQVGSVRDFISEATGNLENLEPLVSDSYTLLFELWVVTNREIRHFQKVIAGIFMRSKLLLIDHELTRIKESVHQSKDKENADKLESTIVSYRSFLKIFLAQLQDAEATSTTESNQDAFDECLRVFFDIESMFQALNFNWLNKENRQLKEMNKALEESTSSLPTIDEATETGAMTSFVDEYLEHPNDMPFQQVPSTANHGKSSSTSSSISSASSSYTFSPVTKSYHSLSTSSYDDNSPYLDYNSLSSKERLDSGLKHFTASSTTIQNPEPRDQKFNTQNLDDDSGSETYLLMEKTNLSKELPKLLNAFNNAKRLEQELKSAASATTNSNDSSEENLRESSTNSRESSTDPSSNENSLSKSQILSNSMLQNNLLDKKKEDLKHNMDFWFNPKRAPNLPSGYNNPLFSKLSTNQAQQHTGFKSNFLNNLYGLNQTYEKK